MSMKVTQKRKKVRLTGPESLRSSSWDTCSSKNAGGKFRQSGIKMQVSNQGQPWLLCNHVMLVISLATTNHGLLCVSVICHDLQLSCHLLPDI